MNNRQHERLTKCRIKIERKITVRVIIARNSYNYDHEDECLVRAAWTSDLHGASSSRKNAVSSGEIGCDIDEEHHPRQSPLLTTSTGWEMGNRCQ